MLLSGAGLLAFAFVDLWGSVRDADLVLKQQARREAEEIAAALRTVLTSEANISHLPKHRRFELKDGEPVIPKEIGWLHTPPNPYTEAALPIRALLGLRAARRAEVIDRDRKASAAALDGALAVDGLSQADREYLLAEAAWQSHRFDDTKRAKRLWEELIRRGSLDAGVAASALLLGGKIAPESATTLESLAARCFDLPKEMADRFPEHDKVQRHRAMLEALDLAPGLIIAGYELSLDGNPGIVFLAGDHGAVLPAAEFEQGLGGLISDPWNWRPKSPPEWDPRWTRQLSNAEVRLAGETYVESAGRYHVVARVAQRAFWSKPSTLTALLSLLGLCFGLGLFLSFRALFRESAAMRSRADFLTSVTHELKTPLSSIRLLSEMLDEGRVRGEDKQREYYRLLAGESARLTVLIENVLDLGRMERGERAYDLRAQDVDEVVEETVKVFGPVASRDGLELRVDLVGGDHNADMDRGALVQAFLNVMDNARKYAAGGKHLDVVSRQRNGSYVLSVRDHGPGIAAADREVIFDRFRRGEEQKSGSVAGVGLGLYLARTIMRAHHGELTCVEPQGGGTEFVFTLPLTGDDERQPSDTETDRA